MERIRKILLVGGTHGNEMTGIHLVREWMRDARPLDRAGADVQLLLANPEAIRLCRRYVDFDLNRAFTPTLLDPTQNSTSYDIQRAREINLQYGPKGSPHSPDLAIDLHNTTANMGITLILNRIDPAMKRICALLSQEFSEVNLFFQPEPESQLSYLSSLGKRDLTIEVGPQPHGTLRATLFQRTRELVHRLLDLVQQWNEGRLPLQPQSVRVFRQIGTLDYPRRDDGSISAMIHSLAEGRDFAPIAPGAPLFLSFDGTEIPWDGPDPLYSCFIGEAAYLEKRIALTQLQSTEESW